MKFALVAISLIFCLSAHAQAPLVSSSLRYEGPPVTPSSGFILFPPPPGGPAFALEAQEAEFLELINAYRAQGGLQPLEISPALTQASRWMSADLASHNYFNHTDFGGRNAFKRMQDFGYSQYSTAGENIAAGGMSAEQVFDQWKHSAGHNANMLNPAFTQIGIGRAFSQASEYKWYWTTDFGAP